MDPVHSQDLIGETAVGVEVLTARVGREIIEAEDIGPVIERAENDAVADECVAVIQLIRRVACVVAAAVYIDENRKVLTFERTAYIYCEAVLVADDRAVVVLDRGGSPGFGFKHILPRGVKDRSFETKRTDRSFSVGNSQKIDDAVTLVSLNFTKSCFYDSLIHFSFSLYMYLLKQ